MKLNSGGSFSERKCTGRRKECLSSRASANQNFVDIIAGCKENGTEGETNAFGQTFGNKGANSHRSISKAVLVSVDHYEI